MSTDLHSARPDWIEATESPIAVLHREGELWVNDAFLEIFPTPPEAPLLGLDDLPVPVRSFFSSLGVEKRRNWTCPKTGRMFEVELAAGAQTQALLFHERPQNQGVRAEQAFLARIGHEFRTPLNGIVGLTNILLEAPMSLNERDLVARVHSNGAALLRLVTDMLEYSKIEAGVLQEEASPTDLRILTREVFEEWKESAEKKALSYRLDLAEKMPASVVIDGERVRRILTNLISNAVKYTNRGEVVVSACFVPAPSGESMDHLRLTVRDSGFGISERERELIFGGFYRAYRSNTGRTAGTGLGLAITSAYVELLRGQLSLQSKLGQGSTFEVLLPIFVHDWHTSEEAERANQRILRRVRVLVVDDAVDNIRVARAILERLGDTVEEATSGERAIELRFSNSYDVILMDVDMPEMTGIEATVLIREREAERGLEPIPIVAVTGHATDAVRRSCLENGMNDYVSKPVDPRLLLGAINHWVDRKAKVMVAQPSLAERSVMVGVLEDAGAHAITASNLEETLSRMESERVDVVVIADHYTDGEGLTLAKKIRDAGFEGMMVAVVAESNQRDPVSWRAATVQHVLVRPLILREFVEVVSGALSSESLDEVPLVDPLLADLVPMFVEQRKRDLKAMIEALSVSDFEAIERFGHNVKGTGASYGFPALTKLGSALQQAASTKDTKICEQILQKMEGVLSGEIG